MEIVFIVADLHLNFFNKLIYLIKLLLAKAILNPEGVCCSLRQQPSCICYLCC